MPLTTQSSNQLLTVFGGGYVSEQHGDDTGHYYSPSEAGGVNFEEVLKVLRGALSVSRSF
jgi:hypothetical protein